MLLEKRTTLPQRILRQIRIETHQSECRIIDQSQRRKTDQSGDWKKARCKRVVVAVGGNCTRAMCVRVRRCLCLSTESARSPPQRLYIADQFVRWSRRVILLMQYFGFSISVMVYDHNLAILSWPFRSTNTNKYLILRKTSTKEEIN